MTATLPVGPAPELAGVFCVLRLLTPDAPPGLRLGVGAGRRGGETWRGLFTPQPLVKGSAAPAVAARGPAWLRPEDAQDRFWTSRSPLASGLPAPRPCAACLLHAASRVPLCGSCRSLVATPRAHGAARAAPGPPLSPGGALSGSRGRQAWAQSHPPSCPGRAPQLCSLRSASGAARGRRGDRLPGRPSHSVSRAWTAFPWQVPRPVALSLQLAPSLAGSAPLGASVVLRPHRHPWKTEAPGCSALIGRVSHTVPSGEAPSRSMRNRLNGRVSSRPPCSWRCDPSPDDFVTRSLVVAVWQRVREKWAGPFRTWEPCPAGSTSRRRAQ